MPIKVTKDGRTIRTGVHYTQFRRELYESQDRRCNTCGGFCDINADIDLPWSFHVDHLNGRGGGKRDDTTEACKGKCGACHRKKHGQSI